MIKKWIRDWLFGGDMADFDTMFKIAADSHESCKKLLKSNEIVLEKYGILVDKYEAVTKQLLDVVQKVGEESNVDSLRFDVMEILLRDKRKK